MKKKLPIFIMTLFLVFGFACTSGPESQEAVDPLMLEDTEEPFEGIAAYVSLGDPQAAIDAFKRAQLENPDDPSTQVLYSNLLLLGGEITEAEKILDELIEENPENTDAFFALSVAAALKGNDEEQQELLENLIEIDPDHALAQASLGELYIESNNLVDAEKALRTSVALSDNVPARIGLGNVYLKAEKYGLAKQEIEAAIDLDEEYSFAFSDLARVNLALDEVGEAEENLNRAIELLPDHFWHYLDRGRVRSQRNMPELAIADFTKAIELNPNIFISYVYRGQILAMQQQFEEAKKDLTIALEMRPDYFPVYGSFGLLNLHLGNFNEAYQWFDQLNDGIRFNQSYLLLSILAKIRGGSYDNNQNELVSEVNRLDRDGIFYKIGRYYLNPGHDASILLDIQQLDDPSLQKRAYAFIGIMFLYEGKDRSAYAMLQNGVGSPVENYPEIILAQWLLNEFDVQE